MKIYSITEILEASNNILERKKFKTIKAVEVKKKSIIEPLILNNPVDKKSEIISTKNLKSNNFNKDLNKKNIDLKKQSKKFENNEIVNELYKLLGRKFRKSTIKVIFDQQVENNKLRKIIKELRQKDLQNLKNNKKLKDQIADLINNEKILNFKFVNFQKDLKNQSDKELILINKNRALENENLHLNKSINSLKQTYNSLEKNNEVLKDKINVLIENESNYLNSNSKFEEKLLVLTESKNFLSEQTKQLKEELELIQKNEKLLLSNNNKLQREVSLLNKNKKLLIEINDQYHEQITELEKNKIKLIDEKTSLEKINNSIESSKQNLIENNYKLKNEISNLIEKEKNLIKNNRSLELENNSIKKMSDEKSEEKQKILNEMNTNLQYELSSLRDSERKLIKNNKKMHEELIKLRASGKQDNSNYNIEELNNLKEKVMFFQEENLRLSHNLSNSQKKYDIMKEQLTDIENEKSKISEKISELTNSLGKTNLVKNPFKEKKIKDISKSIKNIENELDLDTKIKNIFTKS
ncbi:hypothetical protein [Candidatus Pelagibacter sp. RS40]|uniref:hypothetical protein n=1 Tax=Candidatus Pelagibacter sp. RS40 TaxID=1977865 RepID=UPI000A16A628|nr:hypothetical protein [Candidatus Pelagibacter sp. RS40]ARJ49514.1 hypothetical protein B8063_05725 [Candidatus Pelagibacter sp. RS40]